LLDRSAIVNVWADRHWSTRIVWSIGPIAAPRQARSQGCLDHDVSHLVKQGKFRHRVDGWPTENPRLRVGQTEPAGQGYELPVSSAYSGSHPHGARPEIR
jgi:hypothetical protein